MSQGKLEVSRPVCELVSNRKDELPPAPQCSVTVSTFPSEPVIGSSTFM